MQYGKWRQLIPVSGVLYDLVDLLEKNKNDKEIEELIRNTFGKVYQKVPQSGDIATIPLRHLRDVINKINDKFNTLKQ